MINKHDTFIDEILVGKIGLTKYQAKWAVKTSKKYAVWIAKQLQEKGLNMSTRIAIKKIIEWKKKNPAVNLNKYNLDSIIKEMHKTETSGFKIELGSLSNKKVIAVCPGKKYRWVELTTQEDCFEEGRAMNHCLKTSPQDYLPSYHHEDENTKSRLFSLRDEYNKPVLTLQINNGILCQYSGKRNVIPAQEYSIYFNTLETETGLRVAENSKFRFGVFGKLSAAKVHEAMDWIAEYCASELIECSFARELVERLSKEAKAQGLKVKLSPAVINDIERDLEEDDEDDDGSFEYDDDGSLIC